MNDSATLVDVIDRVLDKGIVINADIAISIAGTELLNIRIRAAIASFETAAKYGMAFPLGTNLETAAWNEAMVSKENCPQCKKRQPVEELLESGCPWCGWMSDKARQVNA
ncbi:MAG: gas vesicle protein [Deltaproteobacteria bacterium]|nr:gas vesicle protein [Deltaproteobacteria bacterium]